MSAATPYLTLALDRLEMNGDDGVQALRAEADALRSAAATLESRARRLPYIAAMTQAIAAAGTEAGAI